MQKLKGRLLFMGWHNQPWKLVTDEGDMDLRPIVDVFLKSLNGKQASHSGSPNEYTLCTDTSSGLYLDYMEGCPILKGQAISSNVSYYLSDALLGLSGRLIEFEMEEEGCMYIAPDPSENVFGVRMARGNSCAIPDGAEDTVCKFGEKDQCLFLSVTPDGYGCEKFNGPVARRLLDRFAEGETDAMRIGNCELLPRK